MSLDKHNIASQQEMSQTSVLIPDVQYLRYGEIPPSLEEIQLGVWRIIVERKSSMGIPGMNELVAWNKATFANMMTLVPFIHDVYTVIGFRMSVVYLAAQCWTGIETAMHLYLSSNLLNKIEHSFTAGKPDPQAIGFALLLRFLGVALASIIRWHMSHVEPILRTRVKIHFQHRILQAHLRLDLPTSEDNSTKFNADAAHAWRTVSHVLGLVSVAFSTFSQLAFVMNLVNGQRHGFQLVLLCLASPILAATRYNNLWSRSFVVYASHPYYVRAKALYDIATTSEYKQEVISNGAEELLQEEFLKAEDKLENVSDDYVSSLYGLEESPATSIGLDFLRELPLFAYTVECLMNPERFSVTTIAMLQQTAGSLRRTFHVLQRQRATLVEDIKYVKGLYEGLTIPNTIPSGSLAYPAHSEADEKAASQRGMGIELRDISFSYPGVDPPREVLKNISVTLPPSSLIVIVGANGSGKSTLVKLLTNLHRPSSGEILIDSHPINAYRTADLRKATALLTQDHSVFPLTIAENIGLGDPDNVGYRERIEEATKLGGASGYVAKLPKKWDEILFPVVTSYSSQYPLAQGPIKDAMSKIEKQSDLSGGEKQRLVASRTFMRILSGKIRLLVADEPTSAMDPQGEFELFERLRGRREGKTTVFVTHRFGHLTKHADRILCMKEGELVESGTHRELMMKEGEYFRLYNVQAQAFTEADSGNTTAS